MIDGLVTNEEFEKICQTAWGGRARVTLLGYKTSGRGGRYASKRVATDWMHSFRKPWFWHGWFSVDTALARQYSEELEGMSVAGVSYHVEEGACSAYIDAVSQKLGPSSYSPKRNMTDLSDPTEFAEKFWSLPIEDGSEEDSFLAEPVPVAISRSA